MGTYSTKQLLKLLTAFLELQMMALILKKYHLSEARIKHPELFNVWVGIAGICMNIKHTPSRLNSDKNGTCYLLTWLLRNCPSGTGSGILPVPSAGGVGYDSHNVTCMWGDHPYADNRRILIQECIDQLTAELQSRSVKVG